MSIARRVRSRLARLLVGYPFMYDPTNGEDGVFLIFRGKGASMHMRATKFRMKSASRLMPLDFSRATTFDPAQYGRSHRSYTRFVGTVER